MEPSEKLPLPDTLLLDIFEQLEQNDKMKFGLVSKQFRRIWEFTKCWNDAMSWDYSFQKITIILGGSHFAEFDNRHGDTFRIWQLGYNKTWTQKIPRSKTFFEHARNMFQKKLERNQLRVKSLTIKGTCPINLRRIEHFPQIHTLIFSGGENFERYHEILLKTGDSLKSLTICNVDIADHIYYPEFPIYRVSKFLSIDFNLTATQLMNLNAKRIEMPIGRLQPLDIYRFIRTWMDGNRILEKCTWNLECSDFQIVKSRRFFRFFGARMESVNYHQLYIGGNGKITYRKDDFLQFEVVETEGLD